MQANNIIAITHLMAFHAIRYPNDHFNNNVLSTREFLSLLVMYLVKQPMRPTDLQTLLDSTHFAIDKGRHRHSIPDLRRLSELGYIRKLSKTHNNPRYAREHLYYYITIKGVDIIESYYKTAQRAISEALEIFNNFTPKL